ncbi:MAG: hypothetical protein IJI07_01260 [Flexilinea sp.]|nr:hypothetical protein [Flexilinea sp.]
MKTMHDAFETILKAALPKDCRIFSINMPLQLMNTLTRETAKLCTYLIQQDRIRLNSSGASPVHEVTIEVSLYGSLDEINSMAASVNGMLLGQEIKASGWRFVLKPAQPGKRDVWEPGIQVKREWLQYQGFAIEPENAGADTGTAG